MRESNTITSDALYQFVFLGAQVALKKLTTARTRALAFGIQSEKLPCLITPCGTVAPIDLSGIVNVSLEKCGFSPGTS